MDPNLINPSDVESGFGAQDAASSAIYGARAAFGWSSLLQKAVKRIKSLKLIITAIFHFHHQQHIRILPIHGDPFI